MVVSTPTVSGGRSRIQAATRNTNRGKTWLLWTHGRREQGGLGRYETDGPRILPEK